VSTSTYVFDPEWTMERDRLRALESLFDDASMRHLASLGVTEGWRCLEVGCGAGGIARWLAGRVGSSGRVVAAVRPGGWVVIEDVDFGGPMATALARYSLPAEHAPLVERVYRAAEAVFSAVDADASYGTRLLAGLKAAGLEHVGGEVHTSVVAGGTENWIRGSIQQLGARLEGTGLVSADEVARFLAVAADGSGHYALPFMVTAWGRRPPA
jgi:hypothetical protein